MEFKCKLKVILAEREIRHGEFALKVEISRAAMSGLLNNRSLPSFPVAYRISEELDLDIKEIWSKNEG
ncbi:helix-turn-helix transcriptional regulator [Peribacillus butanolivorans]|uniref:helix-turn-helix transcriptional regulator n=1 Tax=Peribacillus butanolivorans TaxID=421767 RepID=UPI0037F9FD12